MLEVEGVVVNAWVVGHLKEACVGILSITDLKLKPLVAAWRFPRSIRSKMKKMTPSHLELMGRTMLFGDLYGKAEPPYCNARTR